MPKKYTPAVFQPTVRPPWIGALSYMQVEEQAAIFKAILRYPNDTGIVSAYWTETIEPDLRTQYTTFTESNKQKGRASRDYWNKKGEDILSISLPDDNHKDISSLTNDKDMVTILKSKDKDKDKDKTAFDYSCLHLAVPFARWIEYKKLRKEMYSNPITTKAAYNKLKKLSGDDVEKAQQIVTRSLENDWSGLFELPSQKRKPFDPKDIADPYDPTEPTRY